MDKEIKCPVCSSTNVRKFGKVLTKKYGVKQRYQCKKCASSFSLRPTEGEEK